MTDRPTPLFSVVLVIREDDENKHLNNAVQSVWRQRVEAIEMIVADEGASDRLQDRIRQLERRSPMPVHVVRTGGIGPARARNAAAKASNGRYLAFLDVDDEYHAERLDTFRRAALVCGAFSWGFSGVDAIDQQGRSVDVGVIPDSALRASIHISRRPVDAIVNLPVAFTPVSGGNLVVDADLFHELAGFRELEQLSDWDLALRLLRRSAPVTFERLLYRRRVRVPGGAGTSAIGATAAERAAVLDDYRLGLVQDRLAGRSSDGVRPYSVARPLDPDERVVVAVALRGLDWLRKVPRAYAAMRQVARWLRRA